MFSKIHYLSRSRTEKLQLVLPFFFIILAILEVCGSWHVPNSHQRYWIFTSNILFLNSIHVGFTFMILSALPLAQAWRQENQSSFFFIAPSLSLFILFFVFSWFFSKEDDAIGLILALMYRFFGFYHLIKQSLGISLLYDRNFEKQEKRSNDSSFEKIVFSGLIAVTFFRCFTEFSNEYSWWSENANSILIHLLTFSLLSLVLLLFANKLIRHSETRLIKWIFLCRLFLLPLSMVSFLGLIGLVATHGVEYAFIIRKMSLSSGIELSSYLQGFSLVALFTVVTLSLVSTHSGLLSFWVVDGFKGSFLHKLAWVTFSSITFIHYYIDGILFRFKNSWVRENIGPLLIDS